MGAGVRYDRRPNVAVAVVKWVKIENLVQERVAGGPAPAKAEAD